jgi:hypothetical protein
MKKFSIKNLNGWERLWLVFNIVFFIGYLVLFLLIPTQFNQSFSSKFPLSGQIGYESLDFPTYEKRYYNNLSRQHHPIFADAVSQKDKWLDERYSTLFNKSLRREHTGKRCFGEDLIDYEYTSSKTFKPIIFKIYRYTFMSPDYIWESVLPLPPLKENDSCWIGIQIRTPVFEDDFLYFYRPFNLATNDETREIANYLVGKLNGLMNREISFWFAKLLFSTLLFAIITYLVGFTIGWISKGFKI